MGLAEATIVVDEGSCWIRAGIAGEHFPTHVFSAKEFQQNEGSNIGGREKVWAHIFDNVMKLDPRETSLFLTESPMESNENRNIVAEILFEEFGVPALVTGNRAVLSLLHGGCVTGVVLHCGHERSYAVPIYQSAAIPNSTFEVPIAGSELTKRLLESLAQRGYNLKFPGDEEQVRLAKEKLCFVATDFEEQMKLDATEQKRTHKMPDGQFVTIDKERFCVPEVLFGSKEQQSSVDGTSVKLPELCAKAVSSTEEELQNVLYRNVVLSGGTTMLPGFADRMESDLRKLVPPKCSKVRVIAQDDRNHSSWIGGSTLTAVHAFQNLWITKADYEETGHRVASYKCF